MYFVLFIVAQIALLAVLRVLAPKRIAAHASRAHGLPSGMKPESHWFGAGFLKDEKGQRLNLRDKFVGAVAGNSMEDYGMYKGQTFIGRYLDDAKRLELRSGDIVVVNAPAEYSQIGLRLRCVAEVEPVTRQVHFKSDSKGRHRHRDLSQVTVLVEYVVD